MKDVAYRSTRCLLGLAILFVMSLTALAGCSLPNSTEPSAETTPLPATPPPITTIPRDQGAENWHCDDTQPYWWIEWGNDHGRDIGAYDTHCPGHRHPSWYAGVTRGEYQDPRQPHPTTTHRPPTHPSGNHPTGKSSDPYGCKAAVNAGLSMAENPCGNVHINSDETDVEAPSMMSNPKSVWELCNMFPPPRTQPVFRKYCH